MKNSFYKMFAAFLFSIPVCSVLEGTELEIQHKNSPIQTETSAILQQKELFVNLCKMILMMKEAAKRQYITYNIMLEKISTLLVHMQQQQQDKERNRVIELDSPVSVEPNIGDLSIVPYNAHISETEKVNHKDILQQTTTEKDVSTDGESNFLDLPTLFDEGSEYKNSLKYVPTPGERVQNKSAKVNHKDILQQTTTEKDVSTDGESNFLDLPTLFDEGSEYKNSLKYVPTPRERVQNKSAIVPYRSSLLQEGQPQQTVATRPTEIERKNEGTITEKQENSQTKMRTPNKRFQDVAKEALKRKRESANLSISPSQSELQAQTERDKGTILEEVGDKVRESIEGLSEILNSVD